MSKERPADFNPHPGDPWHPDWALEADQQDISAEESSDRGWWRKALSNRGEDGVPEAYAALEEAPEPVHEPEPGLDSEVGLDPDSGLDPEVGLDPDSGLDPELGADSGVSAVARAFEARLTEAEVEDDPEPAASAAAVAIAVAEPELDIQIDLRHEPAPQPDGGVVAEGTDEAVVEAPVKAVVEAPDEAPVEEVAAPGEAAVVLGPELLAEQFQARATMAAVRAKEHSAELMLVDRLTVAEATAHEEAAMWNAVAAVRDHNEDESHNQADLITRAPLDDSWAAEAIAMEESRQRLIEARRRTETEVRTALDSAGGAVRAAPPEDESAVAGRFAAIAAQLRLEERSESARQERGEELRLRTSLLVLDAESPWRESGWSRPGSSFGGSATVLNAPTQVNLMPISTTIGSAMPESPKRRRLPWSRKRITAVTVIEERPVSEKGELGDDGQFELPLESSSVDTPFDLEADEVEGWDEWAIGDSADDAMAEPAEGATSTEAGSTEGIAPTAIEDGAEAAEIEADASHWEDFTAGEYVQTATHEYADLAAAVAAAEDSDAPVQAAIAADMPGLESTLVGLEDVVEAEGLEAAEAAPRSDLALRVGTGIALVILFFASLTYPWAIGALVIIVMVMAAAELATVLLRQQYHPVTLFAYLGTLGLLLGTWAYGLVAIPFTVAATLLIVLLYFGLVAGRDDPLTSMTLTLLAVLWVGVLASFAMDMIGAAEYRWLIGSLVVVVAAMDMAQYFVGKRFGKRPLAPIVSPKKTVAGLVGGVVAAVAVGVGLSFIAPYDQVTGAVLGAALAATGPIGDLAVSVLKRTLGTKDMGTVLPGHGGILDRIDAILFSLPAAWLVYAWASLLV